MPLGNEVSARAAEPHTARQLNTSKAAFRMSKPNKRRVKWLKKIKANARRLTPTVPGKETDYVWDDDPKEQEAMRLENHRRNSLAKLRNIDARFAQTMREHLALRIKTMQRMIEDDLAAIKKLS